MRIHLNDEMKRNILGEIKHIQHILVTQVFHQLQMLFLTGTLQFL